MMTDVARIESVLHDDIVAKLVIDGDLSGLTPTQRVDYYVHRCKLLGLDPGEKPFELLKLDGKLVLYASKTCTNALTRVNRLSVAVVSTQINGDLVTVIARAQDQSGRYTDDVGVLDLSDVTVAGGRNKWGKDVAGIGRPNAIMKCVTKAKRRAVLSLVGLGVLDDSEVDSVRGAKRVALDISTGKIAIEATDAVEDMLGPRCSGKAKQLGDSIDAKCKAVGEVVERTPVAVLAWAMKAAGVDREEYTAAGEGFPSPWRLTVAHGERVRDVLLEKLEELSTETAETMLSTVQRLWESLCDSAPADYVDAAAPAEWARFAGVDEWPATPSTELLSTLISAMEAEQGRIAQGNP